jgi:hypothetical protein
LNSDLFRDELIERDRIAKRTATRMRRGSQKANIRRMAAVYIGMRNAAEHREIMAVRLQQFQIRRSFVFAPRALGKELVCQQTQIVADCQHPARLRGGFRLS